MLAVQTFPGKQTHRFSPTIVVHVPEGDTIHHIATRLRPLLEGRVPERIVTPHPRHALDRWPQRLAGRSVRSVDAYGKHLYIRFEGDLTLHSHLRMTGSWAAYRKGQRWRRSPSHAWLAIETPDATAVQFGGPVLELTSDFRARHDPRLLALGQDVLGEQLDERLLLRRARAGGTSRAVGEVLLDQRVLAGIGNVWKSEACFAVGLDPWRPLDQDGEERLLAAVRFARERMAISAREGIAGRTVAVYGRAGRPCPRCRAPIRCRRQGEDNRVTYWCPSCQS